MITIDYRTRSPSTTPQLVEVNGNTAAGVKAGNATLYARADSPRNDVPQLSPPKRETTQGNVQLSRRHLAWPAPTGLGWVQDLVPEGRNQPAPKLTIEDWSRDPDNVEESILEDYHVEFWLHQSGATGEQNQGRRFTFAEITNLHRHVVRQIEGWRKRPITKIFRYVFLAGIELNCERGGEKRRASVLTAVGVDEDGIREVLGVAEGAANSTTAWLNFFQQLKRQGLFGVRLFIGDHRKGLARHLAKTFHGSKYQNNCSRFREDVLAQVPLSSQLQFAKKMDDIFTSTDWPTASKLIGAMAGELKQLELIATAEFFEKHAWDSLNYLAFPSQHRDLLQSNCAQLELLRSIKARASMSGAFSDGPSGVHLVSARLRYIESKVWKKKCYAQLCP